MVRLSRCWRGDGVPYSVDTGGWGLWPRALLRWEEVAGMERRPWLEWPVYRQLTGPEALARGAAVISPITGGLRPRTVPADRVVDAVCPFCAVSFDQQACADVAPQYPAT